MAGENRLILDGLYTCLDGAAALMSKYKNQWGAKNGNPVFKAGQTFRGNEVARDADGEKIASRSVKRILRSDARVGAAEYGHERILTGHQGFSLGLEIVSRGSTAYISFIALYQSFQSHFGTDYILRFWWGRRFFSCLDDLAGQCAGQQQGACAQSGKLKKTTTT